MVAKPLLFFFLLIELANSMSKKEDTVMSTNVYGGPGNKAYAVVGYLDALDPYTVLWEEYGWKFIEYPSGSKKKRAYLPGGAWNPFPSSFQSGVLGAMNSAQYVYGGPSTTLYASMGSVSANEKVTVLIPNVSGFAFIEYSTSNGSKRAYVSASTLTMTSTTALAKMNYDTPTYSEPYLYGQQIGSLFEEEYVVVLQQNSRMAYIEYNTTSGRKRAYVFNYKLTRVNTTEQVPNLEVSNDYIFAFINNAVDVYGGPSSDNYAVIGSVGPLEDIGMIHKENNWIYIQYATTGGPKRGFISSAMADLVFFVGEGTVDDLEDKTNSYTGWGDLTNAATPVYAGPGTSYASIGSLAANEGVTVFAGAENSFYQIEYTTAAGPKRGFIPDNVLHHYNLGGLAIVNGGPIVVYHTPDLYPTSPQYGAIGEGEYVVILEKNDTRCYVEYNTSSARKRGYTTASGYTYKNMGNVSPLPSLSSDTYIANTDIPVYAGPSSAYFQVGSLNQYEPAIRLAANVLGYSYIQYTGSNTTKRGYVLSSGLSSYQVVIPDFTYANVTKGNYGQSGAGRNLEYYRIGSGNKRLFLNFAIHGFEDNFNQDGAELVDVAGGVIQMLSDNISSVNSHDWSVFVIPSANPDGLIDGNTNNGPGRCTTWRYGSTRAELVQGGVDLNRSFDINFAVNTDSRNYTGPYPNWAKESEALRDFLVANKSASYRNVMIDSHGWLQQIYTIDGSQAYLSRLFKYFFPQNTQMSLNGANGYVSIYAYSLGMEACLFEFPTNVTHPADIQVLGYKAAFVNAIMSLINEEPY
jgi:Zinc carboxypeptidase./Bacterial SH3 domain.